MPGMSIFPAEVSHVSLHGVWLLVGDEELFMPFEYFPWFRSATIAEITAVERPTADHVHWPLLDIDLTIHSIRDPAAFPLVSRQGR